MVTPLQVTLDSFLNIFFVARPQFLNFNIPGPFLFRFFNPSSNISMFFTTCDTHHFKLPRTVSYSFFLFKKGESFQIVLSKLHYKLQKASKNEATLSYNMMFS